MRDTVEGQSSNAETVMMLPCAYLFVVAARAVLRDSCDGTCRPNQASDECGTTAPVICGRYSDVCMEFPAVHVGAYDSWSVKVRSGFLHVPTPSCMCRCVASNACSLRQSVLLFEERCNFALRVDNCASTSMCPCHRFRKDVLTAGIKADLTEKCFGQCGIFLCGISQPSSFCALFEGIH